VQRYALSSETATAMTNVFTTSLKTIRPLKILCIYFLNKNKSYLKKEILPAELIDLLAQLKSKPHGFEEVIVKNNKDAGESSDEEPRITYTKSNDDESLDDDGFGLFGDDDDDVIENNNIESEPICGLFGEEIDLFGDE